MLASLPIYFIVYVAVGLVVSPPLELFPSEENPPGETTGKSPS
jgi:hypothetical protein